MGPYFSFHLKLPSLLGSEIVASRQFQLILKYKSEVVAHMIYFVFDNRKYYR